MSAPPAVGPIIHPSISFHHSSKETQHVLKYNASNLFSGIDIHPNDNLPGPSVVFSEAISIIEDLDGKILIDTVNQRLPSIINNNLEVEQYSTKQRLGLQYLDAGNLIKPCIEYVSSNLNVPDSFTISWMSWITDIVTNGTNGTNTNGMLGRIYAHKLSKQIQVKQNNSNGMKFLNEQEIKQMNLRHGTTNILKWIHAWKNNLDVDGNQVTRGFGYPHGSGNRNFQATYNGAGGTDQGWSDEEQKVPFCFDFPEFQENGQVVLPPPKQ